MNENQYPFMCLNVFNFLLSQSFSNFRFRSYHYAKLCYFTLFYISHVHNLSPNYQINWKIPGQVSRGGEGTPDISHILIFYWFEPIQYLYPVSKFPETTERLGYFIDFADSVGNKLSFKILKNDLSTVLHRIL
jgi:hypothetical protein